METVRPLLQEGVWQRAFESLGDHDLEWMIIDSTRRWVGGKKFNGDQALGRSRGGFSTEIHLAVDALGNPVTFILMRDKRPT